MRVSPLLLLILALAPAAAAQVGSIQNSKHNLSASGPGSVRASSEAEICIFCHTPHNAAPVQPLWNRSTPTSAYTVYASTSLQAKPGQPTGSSKLCLSCHDGTIAVGSVLSRGTPIQMAGGITTLPPGGSNLGTDLSDDHPISFRYDLALTAKNTKLKSPVSLPPSVKLDVQGNMQCSTCHDAHDNRFGSFLVMDNSSSQLCSTCHNQGKTGPEHSFCAACHQPHSAPSGPYLLKAKTVSDTCNTCHNGTTQGANIEADIRKTSRHSMTGAVNVPHIPGNVSCNDCHESHTMINATAQAPLISPKLGSIDGVNAEGAAIPKAQYQYEVCLKCHNGQGSVRAVVTRQIVQTDAKLEFEPRAISFHPVEAAGKNSNVPSLRPGLTTASVIYCTDCHSSDTANASGTTGGPHGSNNGPLLLARYDTADQTSESPESYALCYRCHDRTNILSNASFPGHSQHVTDARTPCSACHDSHGISAAQGTLAKNSHLINFDTTIATPAGGKLEYTASAATGGSCTLTCHGKVHDNLGYTSGPQLARPALRRTAPRRR